MQNGQSVRDPLEHIVLRITRISKKIDELRIKIIDLKQAKKELNELIRNFEHQVLHAIVASEVSSDSE